MTTQSSPFRPADLLTLLMRLALGGSFLSAVADRLGMFGPPGTPGVSWGSFAKFLAYNAQVNSFAPHAALDSLGIAATFFEAIFGLGLVLGVATRFVAIGSGVLLFFYAAAMAVSFGIKSPFDYSVFSALAGALLLGAWGRYPLSVDSLWQRAFHSNRPAFAHNCGPRPQPDLGRPESIPNAKDECGTDPQTRRA